MFLRITDYIERGSVDNRTQGTVLMTLWFKGVQQPIMVELAGDCLQDMAGALLEFRNARATRIPPQALEGQHRLEGIVGDMTSSRKVFSARDKKLHNSLYIEWFSPDGNAFLIEGEQFEHTISLPEWEMDEFDEQAQLMSNQQTMRDHIALWVREYSYLADDDRLPNYKWDIRLKEAEAIALVYMEVIRKYKYEPMGDIRVAFVMGWDHVLDEIAYADETGSPYSSRYTKMLGLFEILNDEEAGIVQDAMEATVFQEIMEITERAHAQFSSQMEKCEKQGTSIPISIHSLYSCLRFITPRVLACLIQEKEDYADFETLGKRIALCADQVKAFLPLSANLQRDFQLRTYEDQFNDIYEALLAYHDSLIAQGKKQHE